MSLEQKFFNLIANTREEARRKVVLEFLDENFGSGKGDLASRYEYTVESFDDYTIVLKRPTNLNKGFDFIVCTPGIYYRTGNSRRHQNPAHRDIIEILSEIKDRIGDDSYILIKQIIGKIFKLDHFDISIVQDITFFDADEIERPLPILLLAIRWLFIEQDITYWNTSGRKMLMDGLVEENLAEY